MILNLFAVDEVRGLIVLMQNDFLNGQILFGSREYFRVILTDDNAISLWIRVTLFGTSVFNIVEAVRGCEDPILRDNRPSAPRQAILPFGHRLGYLHDLSLPRKSAILGAVSADDALARAVLMLHVLEYASHAAAPAVPRLLHIRVFVAFDDGGREVGVVVAAALLLLASRPILVILRLHRAV